MHVRLVAVGARQPAWVNDAFDDYAGRLPRQWRFTLKALPAATRGRNRGADAAVAAEGRAILNECRRSDHVVALDERGTQYTSVALADKLGAWQAGGRDLCFVIGGPDGLSADCVERADERWSLSKLTLPHGLVRVMLAEQLYRAWSLGTGHPYHRA